MGVEVKHGGDITGYVLHYGKQPLDFSASLNPLGLPDGVRRAAIDAMDRVTPYPDPLCRELRKKLSIRLDMPSSRIFCGNGAAEVLFRLVQAAKPRRALIPVPAFIEYEQALRSIGCEVAFHCLDADTGFLLSSAILDRITSDLDMLFLCQPNNPTGQLASPELLRAIVRRCVEKNVLLVVDECFLSFVEQGGEASLLAECPRYPGLVILGSFTKLYAMAGLRLGYCVCGDTGLIDSLYDAGPPWSVSTVAQAAGVAALTETAYVERSLRIIKTEKAFLREALDSAGAFVIGGEANYFFFRDYPGLADALRERGILIRDCANFRGLSPGYYRIAVRLRDENRILVNAIRTIKGR